METYEEVKKRLLGELPRVECSGHKLVAVEVGGSWAWRDENGFRRWFTAAASWIAACEACVACVRMRPGELEAFALQERRLNWMKEPEPVFNFGIVG